VFQKSEKQTKKQKQQTTTDPLGPWWWCVSTYQAGLLLITNYFGGAGRGWWRTFKTSSLILLVDVTEYIQFLLLTISFVSLRQPKLYNISNPFEWMELISLQGKTNVFEKRVCEYAISGIGPIETKHVFDRDTSF